MPNLSNFPNIRGSDFSQLLISYHRTGAVLLLSLQFSKHSRLKFLAPDFPSSGQCCTTTNIYFLFFFAQLQRCFTPNSAGVRCPQTPPRSQPSPRALQRPTTCLQTFWEGRRARRLSVLLLRPKFLPSVLSWGVSWAKRWAAYLIVDFPSCTGPKWFVYPGKSFSDGGEFKLD